MNKQLAKISSAKTSIKDGRFMFWIFVDYESFGSQGVGGIALDNFDEQKKRRVGTKYGCEMLMQLLMALNVDDLSEAKGLVVWVYGEGDGLSFKPKGLSRLSCDVKNSHTIMFDDVFSEYGESK